MESRTRDYHQMAITILAIATAAIGVGLWAPDFDWSLPQVRNYPLAVLYWARISSVVAATFIYFATLVATAQLLVRDRNVTGKDLVRGPLFLLYLQMGHLAFLFLMGFLYALFAEPDRSPATPM